MNINKYEDHRWNNKLIDACHTGNYRHAQFLLESTKTTPRNIDLLNQDGTNALVQAAVRGHQKVVRLLLQHGANPDCKDHYGICPIAHATINKHLKTMKELLRHGAKDDLDRSLIVATGEGYSAGMRHLLINGAHPNSTTASDVPPLAHTISSGNKKNTKILLRYGADPEMIDKNGRPMRFFATMCLSKDLSAKFRKMMPVSENMENYEKYLKSAVRTAHIFDIAGTSTYTQDSGEKIEFSLEYFDHSYFAGLVCKYLETFAHKYPQHKTLSLWLKQKISLLYGDANREIEEYIDQYQRDGVVATSTGTTNHMAAAIFWNQYLILADNTVMACALGEEETHDIGHTLRFMQRLKTQDITTVSPIIQDMFLDDRDPLTEYPKPLQDFFNDHITTEYSTVNNCTWSNTRRALLVLATIKALEVNGIDANTTHLSKEQEDRLTSAAHEHQIVVHDFVRFLKSAVFKKHRLLPEHDRNFMAQLSKRAKKDGVNISKENR